MQNDIELTKQPIEGFTVAPTEILLAKTAFELKGRRHDLPRSIIQDNGSCQIKFNVMDGRSVEESLYTHNYKVWPNYIEAEFDRNYVSAMKKSPNHLIFLTSLIHCQRIIYVYLCHLFGESYNKDEEEKFKIWPTGLSIDLSFMVTDKENLVHKMLVENLSSIGSRKYKINVKSKFNDHLDLSGSCVIYDIR